MKLGRLEHLVGNQNQPRREVVAGRQPAGHGEKANIRKTKKMVSIRKVHHTLKKALGK